MTYVRRLEALDVNPQAIGAPHRGRGGGGTPAHIYVFTDGLVIAPTALLPWSRPHRQLRDLALDDTLTPDAISAAFPEALRLDGTLVSNVALSITRFGVLRVEIERTDGPALAFRAPSRRAAELVEVLHATYGHKVEDRRNEAR